MADSPAAEFAVDAQQIRALLHREAPDLAELPLTLIAAGWDNHLWRLGADLAMRVPRRALGVPLIANEQYALPRIGPALSARGIRTPVPVLTGHATADFPWPWSVMPWISGSAALMSPRAENSRWARELAGALGALHVPAPDDAPSNPVRGRELSTRDDAIRPRLDAFTDRPALRRVWDEGLAAPRSDEHVWVHGDLHPGNVLVDAGRLAALIDFGDVTVGDPAYDLASSWMLFDTDGREAFRAATGSRYDEATWLRAKAWAAYMALVLLTQSDDRPDYLAAGLSTADALAGD